MPTDEINQIQVDPNKVYFITGASLQKLLDTIKANRPLQGAHTTVSESEEGTVINASCDV